MNVKFDCLIKMIINKASGIITLHDSKYFENFQAFEEGQ